MTLPNPQKHVVPTLVLTKSKLVLITSARLVTAAVLKPHVIRPRPAKTVVTKPHSSHRRNINRRPSLKASTFPPKVTAAKAPMVNAVKGVHGNWGNPQHALKDKEVIDNGCSRHMTENMSYLSEFEEINGGYVAFGGNPKGGKFDGKADEGFLVGYSVSSKAFRVFSSRTRIVQETLHINFLENKPNVAGSGPTWLFDIDTVTKTMNYQPVTACNQSNPSAGVQEQFDAEKAREENVQQYVLFPLWSYVFKDFSDDNINEVNAADSLVPAVGAFLYGTIKEEVYVCQPLGFEDPDYPDKKPDEIFISQDKYVAEILRKFGLTDGKSVSIPIDTKKPFLKDHDDVDEAHRKKRKRRNSPRTPPGSPPSQPPPPLPPTGVSGAPESSLMDSMINDDSIPDEQVHLFDDEDTGNDQLPKADTRKDWWKPQPKEERPATLEPAWTIPSSNMSDVENNWATALSSTYATPAENLLLANTRDIMTFTNCLALSISKMKVSRYPDFGLELLVPEQMWINDDTSSVPLMTTLVIDIIVSQLVSTTVQALLPTSAATTTIVTTTTTLPLLPPQPQQSTVDLNLLKRIGELEQHMENLIQDNLALEERLDKHGTRLYNLENLNIP
nr:ribonuclease H-like domain-containing protein [Tanacetum cinerariifolium]